MQNDCFLSSYSDFCLEDLTLPSPQHTDQSPSIKIDSNSIGGQQDYEEIIFVNETPSITAAATGAPYPPVQRVRRRTTVEERQYLENIYAVNKKPDSDLRKQIAQKLQWPEKSVRIWFQNCRQKEAQRAKEKTKRSPPKPVRTSSIREDSSSLSPPPPSSPARKNYLNGQNPQGDGRNMMPNPLSTVSPLLASTTTKPHPRYSNSSSSNIRLMSQQQRTPMKRQRVRSVPSVAFKSTPNRERSRSVSNNFGIGLQKQNGGFGNLTANQTNIDPALSNQLIGNIIFQDHNDFMRQRAMSVDSAMFPFQVLNGNIIPQTQPLAHSVDLNPVSLLDDDLFRQLLVAPTPVTTQIEGEQLLEANSQLLAQAQFTNKAEHDLHHNNHAGEVFNELGLLTTIPDVEMESGGKFEENGVVTSLPFSYSFDISEPTSREVANDDMDLSFLSAFTDSPAAGSQYQMDSMEDQNAASCFGLDDFNDFDMSNQFLNSNMFGGLTVDVPNHELLNPAQSHKRRRLQTSPAALYSEFVKTNEIENDFGLGIDIDNNSQMFEFGNEMVCPSAVEHASSSEMAISDFSSFQNPMPGDMENTADISLDLNQMFPLGGAAPQYNEMLSFDGGNNEFPSHNAEVDQENPLAAWSLESLRQLMMTESGDITKEFDVSTTVTAVNKEKEKQDIGNNGPGNNQHSSGKNESEISSQQSNTYSNQNDSEVLLPPRRSLSMNDIKPYGGESDNSSNETSHRQEERRRNGDGPDGRKDSRLERNGDDIDNTADSESTEEELQRKYFLRSRGKAEEVEE